VGASRLRVNLAYCIITSHHNIPYRPKIGVPTALNHERLKIYGLLALTMNNMCVSHRGVVSKREKIVA